MKQGSISTMHRSTYEAISAMCEKAREYSLSKVDVVLLQRALTFLSSQSVGRRFTPDTDRQK